MAQGARAWGVVCATAVLALAGAASARQAGQDFLSKANALVAPPPGYQDASAALFPVLAKMDPPPVKAMEQETHQTVKEVSLLTPKSPEWSAWEKWATAPAQKAALEALAKATDPKVKQVLGHKYTREGVAPELVSAGLFVDSDNPPLLASAAHGLEYVASLRRISKLASVEATRLAASGDGAGSFRVLVNWLRLMRETADRAFSMEKHAGLLGMCAALERMRDVVYLYPDAFKEKDFQETVRELDLRAIAPERIRFPEGERLALQELLAKAFEARGGPKEDGFAPILGRATAPDRSERPFNVFGEAAQWARLQPEHAGSFDTEDQLKRVYGDWVKRWDLNNLFDELMRQPTDYSMMDRRKFSMLEWVLGGMEELFEERTRMTVELTGTRTALGVLGYRARQKVWPPDVAAVVPAYVPKLDYDPWSYDVKRETWSFFQYFVPMRDQPSGGPRELPKPHEMTVIATSPDSDELGLESAVGSLSKQSPFPPFVDNALRQAMAGGVPSALFKTGTLDLAGFKTFLKDEVGKLAIEPETLKNLREQVIDKMDDMTALMAVQLYAPGSLPGAKAPQIDPAVMKSLRESLNQGLPPEMTDAVTGKLDVNKFKTVIAEKLKASGLPADQQQMVNKALEGLDQKTLEAVFEMIKAAASAQGSLESFTSTLTEKQFVIYSVGRDGARNYAKVVGVGGQDILIWPPVISLQREHLQGATPGGTN